MKLIKSGIPILQEDFNKVEEKIGSKLPKDYCDFMTKNNGGETEEDMLFDFYDESIENENTSVIRAFFSIDGETMDLMKVYDNLVNSQMMSAKMIAIADDPGGNIISISLEKDDYGSVYFLNHEYEEIDSSYLLKSKIAPCFSEFIKQLYQDVE